ncbi:hypothetical protein L6452_10673 [Arctium lappa]|uniref:Uncharacterized protein n=1 Tax=Arctium lappa TaxID=4217 RepID=A0ACB9DN79_ARCLA|nr:hypothetical protein L6452_10673 [Arctium lappa]
MKMEMGSMDSNGDEKGQNSLVSMTVLMLILLAFLLSFSRFPSPPHFPKFHFHLQSPTLFIPKFSSN